jgi:hypothetical protein
MRRSRAPSNSPGTFVVAKFSAGCTSNMFGFDLRQAQWMRGAPLSWFSVLHCRIGRAQFHLASRAPSPAGLISNANSDESRPDATAPAFQVGQS